MNVWKLEEIQGCWGGHTNFNQVRFLLSVSWHAEKHTYIRYLHQVPFAHQFSLFSLQDFLNQLLFAWCSKQDWLPRFQIIQVKHHILRMENISSNLLRFDSTILTLTVRMDSQHSRYCSPACSHSSWGCSTHSRCPGSCHCWWGSWSRSEGRWRSSPGRPDSPTAPAPSSAPAGLAAGRPAADLSPARTENEDEFITSIFIKELSSLMWWLHNMHHYWSSVSISMQIKQWICIPL